MKKILWISRHQMTETQLKDLRRIAGEEIFLEQWDKTVSDIHEIMPLLRDVDIIAAVLPTDYMAELLHLAGDIPVIQSVSFRLPTGRFLTYPDGRREQEYLFEHKYWQRIISIEIKTVRL